VILSEVAPSNFELAARLKALEERVSKLEKALAAKPTVEKPAVRRRRT